MRTITFLSPSSLSKYEENRDEFYLSYLCENRPPKIPQTPPMSVGSAFDSYVKAELYWLAFARRDEKYTFEYLFERSVEPQNRDFAAQAGKHIYDSYVYSGAFAELQALLEASDRPPQFEFKIEKQIEGVPLLGKPDCRFFHRNGTHIILDWKVNGYCSRSAISPAKFYSAVKDGWGPDTAPPSRGAGKSHPGYEPYDHNGLTIHKGYLEDSDTVWADQLSTYAWMLDEPVGSEDVVMAIHQVVAKPQDGQPPLLRIANFAGRVSSKWQKQLLLRYRSAWEVITSGHLFTDLSRADSEAKCAQLDRMANVISGNDANSEFFRRAVR